MQAILDSASDVGMIEAKIGGDGLAARAIAFSEKYKTPMTPTVFAVWYAYCARENAAINEVLDKAMNTGQRLNETVLTALYEEHLSPKSMSDTMVDAGKRLHSTIGEVSDAVERNIKDHTLFSGTLRSAKQSLTHGSSKADVSAVITKLHKANQEHITASQRMAVQLERKRAEVAKLKAELIEAKKASNTDYLTGLPNRRLLKDQMDDALFNARQKNQRITLMMGSVDELRTVNQRFGLAAGDNILRVFAAEIKKNLRTDQVAARFEGSRFAVLLPDTHDREAFAIAERVRKAFREREWVVEHSGAKIGILTASFGGGCLKSGEAPDDLLLRASELLERAQEGVGDMVIIE
ncbi:MAG: GGDEF domain-containing protein [Pseudomonadota bacterium]